MASLNAGAMFGATFLLPLYFQLTRGADAALSGTLMVPFLAATCVGAFSGGQVARRIGKVKGLIQFGLIAGLLGFVALVFIDENTPHAVALVTMFIVGLGIGLVMPCTLVNIQNAAERRDVGAATGAFLFLRSMGGALGSTVAGVVLSGQFDAAIVRLGLPDTVNLGALRVSEGAAALDPSMLLGAHQALAFAFHAAFIACAALMVLALAASFGLPDVKLRTTN
jgi:MFS family permease